MKNAHVFWLALLWAAASSGCGNDPQSSAPGAPAAGTGAQTPAVSEPAGAAAVSGSAGSASGVAGATAGSRAPVAGSGGAAAGSSGSAAGGGAAGAGAGAAAGGGAAGSAGEAAGSGGAGSGGAAGMPPGTPATIPMPVAAPMIWGFGIGITDVPAASKFYTEVMKMTVEKEAVDRDDSTETVFYATEAKRGARLVLMKFDDMRNTRKITAKLVWQSSNAAAVNRAAAMHPDYESRLNIGIVQFDGPETNVHEVGGVFDTGGSGIDVPYPIALGFATSDLAASRKFYTALGMTESSIGSFGVTDINGRGNITEYSVKFAEGSGLVLQQWSPMRNAKDNPIKVVMFVPDAKAMGDKVAAAGGTVVKPVERSPAYDHRNLVIAKDLDGYLLDIVE